MAQPESSGQHFSRRVFSLHDELRPRCQALGIAAQYFLFDPQNLGRVHGKVPQAQTDQQTGQRRISGHFTAQRDLFARCCTLRDGVGQQMQYRWVQGVVQMRHLFVRAVNRQGVLNQVIGADRQKVEMLQEQGQA